MLSGLWEEIKSNPIPTISIIVGLAIVVFSFRYPQWWGERALGVIVGSAVLSVIILAAILLNGKIKFDIGQYVAPIMLLGTTVTALILRKATSDSGLHLPVQLTIGVPSHQTVLLTLFGIGLLLLLIAFGRSLSRGEGVSFESHWGGLGGGITGWKVSSPLIYLLGILFLLLFSAAIAWRIFIQTNSQQTNSTTTTATASQSP